MKDVVHYRDVIALKKMMFWPHQSKLPLMSFYPSLFSLMQFSFVSLLEDKCSRLCVSEKDYRREKNKNKYAKELYNQKVLKVTLSEQQTPGEATISSLYVETKRPK